MEPETEGPKTQEWRHRTVFPRRRPVRGFPLGVIMGALCEGFSSKLPEQNDEGRNHVNGQGHESTSKGKQCAHIAKLLKYWIS